MPIGLRCCTSLYKIVGAIIVPFTTGACDKTCSPLDCKHRAINFKIKFFSSLIYSYTCVRVSFYIRTIILAKIIFKNTKIIFWYFQ